MSTRVRTFIGGALVGLAVLTATAGPLSAQEPDAAAEGTPMVDQGAMMPGGMAETGDGEMAGQMEQMMDQCLAMMEMMSMMMDMMGGDMSGMEDMPAAEATPAP